jgi:hypothetical protein
MFNRVFKAQRNEVLKRLNALIAAEEGKSSSSKEKTILGGPA